ncbi:MAG: recombination regulator RecX [Deltaproteobacteria bacterium]|nr:recombination regulator RecX [Deltaproteobacteria bacterium]
MIKKESPIEAALRIISRQRISSNELKKKMRLKGYGPEDIDKAIMYLEESHYLDDNELLSDHIKYLAEKRLYGPERIVSSLIRKGFDEIEIRNRVYEIFDEEDFVNNAKILINKKFRDGELTNGRRREKVIRTLIYKGYNWELIERIINEY